MMSRKKSSGWTMVKALYVLPIAAFAAIAFANCSKTESEITTKKLSDAFSQEQCNQIRDFVKELGKDGTYIVKYDEDGVSTAYRMYTDETLKSVDIEEIKGNKNTESKVPVFFIDDTPEPEIDWDKVDYEKDVFQIVEEMPDFPGGELALRKFIAENIKYPEEAKIGKIEGKSYVQFVIDRDGYVKDVEIAGSSKSEILDNEAIRVVKSLPQWKPGMQRGQNVNVSYVVPINFQLN